jgi:hypothetical protein
MHLGDYFCLQEGRCGKRIIARIVLKTKKNYNENTIIESERIEL